jgi:hypothetical protein
VNTFSSQSPRWRKDGRELFFLGGDGTVYVVAVTPRASSLDFGPARPLFKLPRIAGGSFDVTADGQRFVTVIKGEPDRTPLKVVVGYK